MCYLVWRVNYCEREGVTSDLKSIKLSTPEARHVLFSVESRLL